MIIFDPLLFGLWLWCSWHFQNIYDASLKEQRAITEEHYRCLIVQSADPRYAFNAQTAEVVFAKERIERSRRNEVGTYNMIRYARNEYGEYFMIVSGSDPFFKHVSQQIAKVILKKKYREPPTTHS